MDQKKVVAVKKENRRSVRLRRQLQNSAAPVPTPATFVGTQTPSIKSSTNR
jgi:hypothetical protein